MQPLTAPPRDSLTSAQVTDLLLASSLDVEMGAELLDSTLVVVEDISEDLAGGQVDRNMHATIHGTCRLLLSRELAWGTDLVRPYVTLDDGVVSARWNLGVFALVSPERQVGETPELFDVQGYDRLLLLDRQVGADYTVTSGSSYRTALLDVFTAAGLTGVLIEGGAADSTLPADKTWSLVADDQADPDQTSTPVTYLRIVNDLLRAINFRAVWCDQDGLFRCEGYQAPVSRAVEFTFDAGDEQVTIVGEDRRLREDLWAVPNRWVFRWSNGGTGIEGDGVYTVLNQSDGPTSIDERGLTWTSVVDFEAASQAKLEDLGDRRVAADRRVTSVLEVTTGPFPGAGHGDVFQLVDPVIGDRKVQATSWSLPLDGGDMSWSWERVL